MKYLVANWKANKTTAEAIKWLQQSSKLPGLAKAKPRAGKAQSSKLKIILAAAFIHLSSLKEIIEKNKLNFCLAAQDVSLFPFGAYTGEVAAEMLKGLVDYVIVGHSERRRYFGETDELVAKKIKQALDFQIMPIVCVDEPYLESQIKTMEQWNNGTMEQFIFAYEPLRAIGTGKPDTPENANQLARQIKDAAKFNAPILYGGSVTNKNVKAFIDQEEIDGVLVGGASLEAKEFIKIIQAIQI